MVDLPLSEQGMHVAAMQGLVHRQSHPELPEYMGCILHR
jgi:hypothetical protein